MKDHNQRIVHSSENPNWRTPPVLYQALDQEFRFCLDAASDHVGCLARPGGEVYCWLGPGSIHGEDALAVDWAALLTSVAFDALDDPRDRPPIFLNPPYSRKVAAALKANGDPNHESYRIENWAHKCWLESQKGCTIVGLFPFAPQTEWYRWYVLGHTVDGDWSGHAAKEERRLPHRVSFLHPDGSKANNAGVNTAIIVWTPMTGAVGPWQPHSWYWSYR